MIEKKSQLYGGVRVVPDPTKANTAFRILIIDDEDDWRLRIKLYTQLLGHDSEAADSFEKAIALLVEAERQQRPFSIAIIDMKFKTGMVETEDGTDILRYIKSNYPYIACIMVTGWSDVDPLALRDLYGLDSYMPKARCDKAIFARKIAQAMQRVQDAGKKDDPQPQPEPESAQTFDRQRLHQRLIEGFDLEEMNNLIFYLGLTPGEIAGDTIPIKARNLVLYCERRRGLLDKLQDKLDRMRPQQN